MSIVSSMHHHEDAPTLTAFDYLYRDAGNFKSFGTILLRGTATSATRQRIIATMESEEFFIAEQVSLPSLYEKLAVLSGGKTSSDHAWHSFQAFRQPTACEASIPVWGTVAELLQAFEAVRDWDILASPNHASPRLENRCI
jgi:hypothetical protein